LMLEAREGQLKLEESELDAFEKDAIVKPSGGEDKMSDLLDDDGIVANCVLFILAGFDTTQSLLLFCAYALALNQDVQERLRDEVNGVVDENDGELTYDGLQKMTYLDMIING
jgi:cytochrome P450 family 9